jgi:hypothetical protein
MGMGNYEPTSSHKAKLKRAHRLWKHAYSNFQAMIRHPDWWKANARNQAYSRLMPRRSQLRRLSRSM